MISFVSRLMPAPAPPIDLNYQECTIEIRISFSGCPPPLLLTAGDGICDGIANSKDCNYDGGDCCLLPLVGCTYCTCHETWGSNSV